MAVTDWGRIVRSIRLRRGELLYDMAKKLKLRTSELSGYENGRIAVPPRLNEKIKAVYDLTEEEIELLDKAEMGNMEFVRIDKKSEPYKF